MGEPGTVESAPWTREDTERWLTDYPLPATFTFNGERAYPKYRLRFGYGQWLRTAGPYHPALRGLFATCHEILASIPIGQPMPGAEQLAALVLERVQRNAQLPLLPEDDAAKTALVHPSRLTADDEDPAL